jgi:transposase
VIKKVWAPKGSKPRVKITGSHKKSFVFGSLSLDGKQLFRQFDEMNSKTFLQYLKCLKRKYRKFVFFYDGAPWHKAKEIKKFFRENSDCILPVPFPKCSPEFNAVEECWRDGKEDILGSTYPPSFEDLQRILSSYYRTKRFRLDMVRYLCH